jgi:NIMA (never in mitosis gene a)-related kinase
MEPSVFGSYTNLGLIGSGSYGKVYKVQKHSNKHIYAMKKLKLSNIKSYDRRSMLNELKILSSHKCPFLIEYKCSFIEGLYLCIIMQYCGKGTLESIIKKDIPNDKIWKYFSQITYALNYLHKNQIIYRDLKSSNVLIDDQDNVRLIDFGISKIMNSYVKYTKTCIGTPYYMSPEVLSNINYSFKTDIWSLGILLYEMTQKQVPFLAKNIYELNHKIGLARFDFKRNTHEPFKVIIKKCLQSSSYRRISLHDLLQIPEIKSYIVKEIEHIQQSLKFNEINVPSRTKDWSNAVRKLPCRTTPDPVKIESTIKMANFMEHYTNSQLIALNSRLLEQIYQKNEHILALEIELKKLKS